MNLLQRLGLGLSVSAIISALLVAGPGIIAEATVTPTTAPTTFPTSAPTTFPTTFPTTAATTGPTTAPTTVPTTAATTAPGVGPTTYPTTVPVVAPTTVPTTGPTTVPTTAPTVAATTFPTTAPTTVAYNAPTTAPTTFPTTAPTSVPVYGAPSDASEVATLASVGATHAWPMNDASSTQFGVNDAIGTDNIAFSEGTYTGYAPCYAIVDGSTGSTQFTSAFTGNATTGTVTLPSSSSWTVGITAIPSSLPTGSNVMELLNTGNPILDHAGIDLSIHTNGVVYLDWGTGTTYNNLSSGVTLTAQTLGAFTLGYPIIASWNAATLVFSLSVGNSTYVTRTLTTAYTASSYNLSVVRDPQNNASLVPFQGYLQYLFYAPSALSQSAVNTINYQQNGPTPAPTMGAVMPLKADSIVAGTGADTHFSYTSYSDPAIKTTLNGSNFRHVRDATPGTLPVGIGNGVALAIPADSPYYKSGNGVFTETECTAAERLAVGTPGTAPVSKDDCTNPHGGGLATLSSPNYDYIELCGNEQDSDGNITPIPSTDDPYHDSFAMLASCVSEELGWINTNNLNPKNVPIVLPSLINADNTPDLAAALTAAGVNTNGLYVNFHPGSGSLYPNAQAPCETSGNNPTGQAGSGFPICPTPYSGNLMGKIAYYASQISGQYFVTEFGFSDRKDPTLTVNGGGYYEPDMYIYNRVNGIPESQITAYDPRSLLDWQLYGATRMYFYQFADDANDCSFGAQGLITPNISNLPGGNPGYQNDDCSGTYTYYNTVTLKPEYSAVNGLLGLLSDPTSFSTSPVPAYINGVLVSNTPFPLGNNFPSNNDFTMQAMVTQKHDGSVYLLMWRDETDFNWYGNASCPTGSSYVDLTNALIGYPQKSNPIGETNCQVTGTTYSVTMPGYTETDEYDFNADGSITDNTSGLNPNVQLNTPYIKVLRFVP